jgi:hypothetical protein
VAVWIVSGRAFLEDCPSPFSAPRGFAAKEESETMMK